VSYKVAIQKIETGEIRMRDVEFPWDEASDYWWTEGNMGCDCNLELEWRRAGGVGPADDPNHNTAERECGNVVYRTLYALLPSGEKVELMGPADQTSDSP
jgi:hypothetical protein